MVQADFTLNCTRRRAPHSELDRREHERVSCKEGHGGLRDAAGYQQEPPRVETRCTEKVSLWLIRGLLQVRAYHHNFADFLVLSRRLACRSHGTSILLSHRTGNQVVFCHTPDAHDNYE